MIETDEALSLGIDVGTTAIKMIVVSSTGEIKGTWTKTHDLLSPHPGFAEEDPAVWEKNVYALLHEVTQEVEPGAIKAIGVTGMVPALIALDNDLKPLMNSIQQNDIRSEREIKELEAQIDPDWFFSKTGNKVNQQHLFPKLLWISRNRPEVFAKIQFILGSYDYIAYLLTGIVQVEHNWALESGMWDIKEACWLHALFPLAGIERSWLPPVSQTTDIVGMTTKKLEELTGLQAGIPVIAGTADHIASSYCTGARKPGDLVLKLGGAGDILLALDFLVTDNRLFIDYGCSRDVPFLLNGCTASSGSMLKWFQNEFSFTDFLEMDKMAEFVTPGSEGVVILPYFLGEKTPLFDVNAKGVIYGLSLSHTKAHVYRAMLEAVAFSFRHHIEVFSELNLPIKRVFITNGGSKSMLWRSIMADVIGYDLQYVKHNPGSCLGASLLAGIGCGIMEEKIADCFMDDLLDIPYNPENHLLYERPYEIYRHLYEALKPITIGLL
ncbi:FGGY-family carbohydrate kinase [uncultured Sphaerochaeta sp.]|uniref:FGGY-family carbohydrate kinase n=1 Tax=uncultured Sphaerochaeta sp. TaxID=886478 RepID=UPI0037489BA7